MELSMNEKEKQREAENSARERLRRELEESFSYDNYLVARKELFAHLRDPAIVIRPDSITFNQACIDGLPDVVYIRLSVNEQLHRILVEPCEEDTPHALRWCIQGADRRRSRKMTGAPFANLLYQVMGWDKSIRYKVLGFRIQLGGYSGYVFLLDTSEKFNNPEPTSRKKKRENETGAVETGVPKMPRKVAKGYYDEEVLGSFGIPMKQYFQETAVTSTNGFVQIGMLTGAVGSRPQEEENRHE